MSNIDKHIFATVKDQPKFENDLLLYPNKAKFNYDLAYTQYSRHATEISKSAIGKYDIVAAIGGDGTVNEVSRGLIDSSIIMAIIPIGSGNGLAHFLNIPINTRKAIQVNYVPAKAGSFGVGYKPTKDHPRF
jgi:diacylglycerol kinase family enzyme